MAVGPIGSAIYTNQMTPAATSVQNAHNNRVDFQNMVAQAVANDKEKKILEVRPTEENQEVDPDREHQRDEADRNNQESKKDENEQESEPKEQTVHKLDITV